MSRRHWIALAWLCALGCARETPPEPRAIRPVAGDVITPELFLVPPWKAGGKAQVTIRLQLAGGDPNKPEFIQFDDVPEEVTPQAVVTFWKDDGVLERRADLIMKRDC